MNRVDAAHSAIGILERGGAVGTELLSLICDPGSVEFLQRRRKSAFAPTCNTQRLTAIWALQAYIVYETERIIAS